MRRLFLALALASTPLAAAELPPDLAQALRQAAPGQSVAVIVSLPAPPALDLPPTLSRNERVAALAERSEQALARLETKLEALGSGPALRLWAIGAIATRLPAAAVQALARDPEIGAIRLDAEVTAPTTLYQGGANAEWNIAALRAPDLWAQGITGKGVTVAVLDTGIDARHPELSAGFRGGTNSWYDPHGQHATPYDASGHGTHVAGLAVGARAGSPAVGVAPGAKWMAAKLFDDAGTTRLSLIHASLQWVLDPDGDPGTDDAPQVAVMAWSLDGGVGTCSSEFAADLAALDSAGIAVAAAAGNLGPYAGTSVGPANNAGAVAVGALDAGLAPAEFSSRGPSACGGGLYPTLAAPGVAVRAPDLTYGGLFPDSYAAVSGTSFAAPQVGGVMALLASSHGGATPAQLRQALSDGAFDVAAAGPDNDSGAGLADALGAFRRLGNGTALVDADGDGYAAGPDCRDNLASAHPGAAEIKRDGIDQDCNGWDLTIEVRRVAWSASRRTLVVEATSTLGAKAALAVDGIGALRWDSRRRLWSQSFRLNALPATVTVKGIEGRVTVAPVAG